MISITFTVSGNTLDEIRARADERLAEFAPGRQWTKVDIDARPIAIYHDGTCYWEGRVEAVS